MTAQNILKMEGVSKNYRLGKTVIPALKDIFFEIFKGDLVVFAGASGSGKTTLLNIIGLLDKPSSGEIWLDSENISSRSLESLYTYRRDNLGFIFQTFNLIPVLNVFENIEYPLILKNIFYKKRKELVNNILEKAGLYERRKHRPNELSGGERQRVSIARAVVKNPKVVLADEPTANLDSVTGMEIIELMEKLNTEDGTTFIFSSHDPKIIDRGRRVVNLRDGEIKGIKER